MTLATGPNLSRYRSVWTGVDGAPYYTNFYADDGGGFEESVEAVAQFWTDLRDHFVGGTVITVEAAVAQIEIATGEIVGVDSFGSNLTVTGNAGAGPLPPANQALVTWSTGEFVSGRQLRGRTFIPALSAADNASGNVAGGLLDDLSEAADTLQGIGAFPGGGFNGAGAIWSRTHGVAALISGHSENTEFAVLRSRRD